MSGKIITLDGIDGAGKTSHIKSVDKILKDRGIRTFKVFFPGTTFLGLNIKRLLHHGKFKSMDKQTQYLLFAADLAETVNKMMRPALERGLWVVTDRYFTSAYAYQWRGGKGVNKSLLNAVTEEICGDLHPDLFLLFDCDIAVANDRVRRRRDTQANDMMFKDNSMETFSDVRKTYLHMAKENPHYRVINANQSFGEVFKSVKKEIDNFIDHSSPPIK